MKYSAQHKSLASSALPTLFQWKLGEEIFATHAIGIGRMCQIKLCTWIWIPTWSTKYFWCTKKFCSQHSMILYMVLLQKLCKNKSFRLFVLFVALWRKSNFPLTNWNHNITDSDTYVRTTNRRPPLPLRFKVCIQSLWSKSFDSIFSDSWVMWWASYYSVSPYYAMPIVIHCLFGWQWQHPVCIPACSSIANRAVKAASLMG